MCWGANTDTSPRGEQVETRERAVHELFTPFDDLAPENLTMGLFSIDGKYWWVRQMLAVSSV